MSKRAAAIQLTADNAELDEENIEAVSDIVCRKDLTVW